MNYVDSRPNSRKNTAFSNFSSIVSMRPKEVTTLLMANDKSAILFMVVSILSKGT